MSDATEQSLKKQIEDLQNRLGEMIDDREREAMLARRASDRINLLEAMMEIVPVGVVVADNNGRIIMGNNAVEQIVRHPVLHSHDVDAYGEWISFHENGEQVQSHEYPLSRVIRDNEEYSELDVHYQRGDGSLLWMRIVGRPVRDNSGERLGAAVALIDINRERQLMEQQKLLIGELNHRVKNAFSVVKSIVSQSLRKIEIPRGLRQTIDQRLDAYAAAHSKLVGSSWDHAPLDMIARDIVSKIAGRRARIVGAPVMLPSRQALALSMAFYELTTNAVKYGALSTPEGEVSLSWDVTEESDGHMLSIQWVERNGPPVVTPQEKGFGSFIIDRALAMETSGSVEGTYDPEGFKWQLQMPVCRMEELDDKG